VTTLTQAASAGGITLTSTAASSDVLLSNANDMTGAITFAGTLSNFRNVNLQNTDAAALMPTNLGSLSNLNNLTLTYDNAAIAFPTITAAGNLSATAGGAITETGALIVTGTQL